MHGTSGLAKLNEINRDLFGFQPIINVNQSQPQCPPSPALKLPRSLAMNRP